MLFFRSFFSAGVIFSASGDDGAAHEKLAQNLAIDKEEEAVIIDVQEPITKTFSMHHLNLFTKAAPLCVQVQLSMSADSPLLVEYEIPGHGYIRFYLADRVEN